MPDSAAAASGESTGPGAAGSARRLLSRWRLQLILTAGALAWLLWLVALWSHDAADAAFSTSGDGWPTRNRIGVLGAWLSDLSYVLLGDTLDALTGARSGHSGERLAGADPLQLARRLEGGTPV